MAGPVTPLGFSTAAVDKLREELLTSKAPIIDFFGIHTSRVEDQPGARGCMRRGGCTVGDFRRHNDPTPRPCGHGDDVTPELRRERRGQDADPCSGAAASRAR
jgi:hypothetical protein